MHGEVAAVRGEVETVSEAVEAVEQKKNNMGGEVVTNVGYPSENDHAATKAYVDDELLFFDGFSGIPGHLRRIKNIEEPTENTDVATKYYVDQIHETVLEEIGESKNDMEGQKIIHVGTPTEATDAATKIYVDTAVAGSAAASAVVTGARVAQWVRALS